MSITNEAKAKALQTEYGKNKDTIFLGRLYFILKEITKEIIKKAMAKNAKLNIDIDVVAHDAATKLIEKYLKDNTYIVRHAFGTILYPLVKHQLYDKKLRKREKAEVNADIGQFAAIETIDWDQEMTDFLDELIHEDKRILLMLLKYKRYGDVVKRIAKEKGEKWIRDRAKLLYRLWKVYADYSLGQIIMGETIYDRDTIY